MTHSSPLSAVANDDIEALLPAEAETNRALSKWFVPLEVIAAVLMVVIVGCCSAASSHAMSSITQSTGSTRPCRSRSSGWR